MRWRAARAAGVQIEYLRRSKGLRKEDLVAKVLTKRGCHPGLVHALSVMEACTTFKPWHDRGGGGRPAGGRAKATGRTGLKTATGKCATFYFYLIDPEFGRMYVRVPTWLPCRLPFRQAQGPERSRGANLLPRRPARHPAGRVAIPGLSNKRLRAVLGQKTSAQIARILRRLRNHRLIKRVAHTYRYYLSALGQRLILAARKIFEHGLIPNLQP